MAVSDVGEQFAAPAAPPDGEPVSPAPRVTDRDLFNAVSALLPDAASAREVADTSSGLRPPSPQGEGRARGISAEELLRAACRLMAAALALNPDEYHTYSCGVLDLVHALTEEV